MIYFPLRESEKVFVCVCVSCVCVCECVCLSGWECINQTLGLDKSPLEAEGRANRDQGLSQRIQPPPAYIKISRALLHIHRAQHCKLQLKVNVWKADIRHAVIWWTRKNAATFSVNVKRRKLSSHTVWNSCFSPEERRMWRLTHLNARSGLHRQGCFSLRSPWPGTFSEFTSLKSSIEPLLAWSDRTSAPDHTMLPVLRSVHL